MAWYKTGTVSTTNGSTSVIGVQTLWSSQVKAGDMFSADHDHVYEVASVESDTELTLATPYLGETASAQPYVIVPVGSSWGMNTQLASDLAALIQDYQSRLDSETKSVIRGDKGDPGLNYRGGWVASIPYYGLDVVWHDGSLYVCACAVSDDTTPDVDTDHWACMTTTVNHVRRVGIPV